MFGLSPIVYVLIFLAIAGAVTYFYVIPTFFPKKVEVNCHLEEFSEYEETIEAVQKVEYNNITFQVPFKVSKYKTKNDSVAYMDKDEKLTILVNDTKGAY